eukprot:scaffold105055_cov17-Tisochrysis_lutea.AAC.1
MAGTPQQESALPSDGAVLALSPLRLAKAGPAGSAADDSLTAPTSTAALQPPSPPPAAETSGSGAQMPQVTHNDEVFGDPDPNLRLSESGKAPQQRAGKVYHGLCNPGAEEARLEYAEGDPKPDPMQPPSHNS